MLAIFNPIVDGQEIVSDTRGPVAVTEDGRGGLLVDVSDLRATRLTDRLIVRPIDSDDDSFAFDFSGETHYGNDLVSWEYVAADGRQLTIFND